MDLRRLPLAVIALGAILFFATWVDAGVDLSRGGPDIPNLLIVQVPISAPAPSHGCSDGSRIVRLEESDGRIIETVLTEDFSSACDPEVSFDGKIILFSGKREPTDSLGIWRIQDLGSGAEQVISCRSDCFSPLYVGSLFHLNDDEPTDRMVYLSTEDHSADEFSAGPLTALYAANLDGGNPWKISYGLNSARDPSVLANGRILFSRSRRLGNGRSFDALMAVNNDGTDLMAYTGAHDGAPYKAMPKPGLDGRTYFVEAETVGPLGGGALAAVSQRRPLHGRLMYPKFSDGFFHSPLPLQDGRLMISYLDTGDSGVGYQLFWADAENGSLLGKVYGTDGYHVVDAQELAPHTRVKGRSSFVDMGKKTGVFFCISSHITDRPGYEHLGPDTIRSLRVIEGVPGRWGEQSAVRPPSRRPLGVVPVEKDGSFHIEVPAQTPLAFELLDEKGSVVAEQSSWTWVMPRESRGCIGCHEDREMAVPNILADAVVKPAAVLIRGDAR